MRLRYLAFLLGFCLVRSASLQGQTVLVLPFFNQTKSSNLNWIGESVAEEVSETMASSGWLTVARDTRDEGLRRLSVRKYAILAQGSVMEISLNLDADTVVWGEFEEPDEGQIRIVVRIANVKGMKRSPERVEIGPLEQLSRLQNTLARHVLNELSAGRKVDEGEFTSAHPPVRLDALESYTRGLLATTFEQKHRLLANAARLDPAFSQPSYQLGKLQYGRQQYQTATDWLKKVTRGNSHFREAQFFLGLCRFRVGDFAAARDAFRTVAEEVPLAEVFNNLGAAQLRLGDAEAIANFQKALESEKSDPIYYFNLGYALWRRGEFDQAAEFFRAALDRTPGDQSATLLLGRCLKRSGPRAGDLRTEALERLKVNYDESAWRHLRAVLGSEGK